MDYILTVCDQAAGEQCPVWLGHPVTAHWGIPDPAAVEGSHNERMAAFCQAYARLELRVKKFLSLTDALDPAALKAKLEEIGRIDDSLVESAS